MAFRGQLPYVANDKFSGKFYNLSVTIFFGAFLTQVHNSEYLSNTSSAVRTPKG